MRKFLLMLFCMCIWFTSCKDDESDKFDWDRPLYVNGVDKANKAIVYTKRLSASEIVRLDDFWLYTNSGTIVSWHFSFAEGNIDTINNRLLLPAGFINNGTYDNPFFDLENYYIIKDVKDTIGFSGTVDTLAYIPNAQRHRAKELIDSLYVLEQWDKIYDIFQNAFTFIPCTGEELRELEKSGNW